MDLVTLGLAAVALPLLYIYTKKQQVQNRIPGPFRLPLLGNIQFDFPRLHKQFTEYAEQFGDVFRIQILTQPCVVLNSEEAMREAYLKRGRDFIGRPHMYRFQIVGATNGIAFRDYSDKQKQLRHDAVKDLRHESLHQLTNLINDNLEELVAAIHSQNEQAFHPKILIKKYLVNVVISLIFGEKISFDDPLMDKVIEFNDAALESATIGKEDIDVWTWTKYFNPNYTLALKARKLFFSNIYPLYQKYKDTYIEGHERGVIDKHISQVRSGLISEEDVLGMLIDYLVGGVETTATTLHGFLLVLLHNQKIQKQIQSEVDEVVGCDRNPRISDKVRMPYAEACMLELLRYQSPVPILLPRKTVVDTEIKGYTIPKNTWVYTNSWAIHRNEKIYPDADLYKPERFLDSEGHLYPAHHETRRSIVSFGMGARNCIGQNLAKSRLFLSLCTLMQNFTFEADEKHPPPSADPRDYKLQLIFDIADYTLKAKPRW